MEHVATAILGTGFSGLAVAAALKRGGDGELVLLERASALGGVWRDNVYPGCACDIPSYLYSFTFADAFEWTHRYARQPEIRAYLERCADVLDLRRHVRLGWEAASAAWDGASARWVVRSRRGEALAARALVLGVGALSEPALPAVEGAERFRGPRFHSARWEPSFDPRGKRVVVIGTGASAIQIVPALQPLVARLTVVQRTPAWVLPRGDRPFHRWERALLRRRAFRRAYRAWLAFRHEARAIAFLHPALMRLVALQGRLHLRRAIRDPRLRALLTPAYLPGCKRILLSDDYYPALARENVEVVAGDVRALDEDGVRLDSGRRVEADAIVYGTGFAVLGYPGPVTIRGAGGDALADRWRDRPHAYLGTTVAGFPNLFLMTGPNTGLGHSSMVEIIEAQARYVAQAIRLLRRTGAAALDVRPEVEARYNRWLDARAATAVWSTGCRSWYLDGRGRNVALWPGTVRAFQARLAALRPEDYVLTPAAASRAAGGEVG